MNWILDSGEAREDVLSDPEEVSDERNSQDNCSYPSEEEIEDEVEEEREEAYCPGHEAEFLEIIESFPGPTGKQPLIAKNHESSNNHGPRSDRDQCAVEKEEEYCWY